MCSYNIEFKVCRLLKGFFCKDGSGRCYVFRWIVFFEYDWCKESYRRGIRGKLDNDCLMLVIVIFWGKECNWFIDKLIIRFVVYICGVILVENKELLFFVLVFGCFS